MNETVAQVDDKEPQPILQMAPSPRRGKPADLVAAVTNLLSDDAECINGQVWAIDDGTTMRD